VKTPVSPLELALPLTPRARLDVIDVKAQVAGTHGEQLEPYARRLYVSGHTTAGYLSQSVATRLASRPELLSRYLEFFGTMFPAGAGYRHDQLELRSELAPEQKLTEPLNGDSHLAFIGSGLHACVTYDARRAGPAYFIDLDGTYEGQPRQRATTIVGYNVEEVVARTSLRVPLSAHPVDAVNLKDERFGLYPQLAELIAAHGVAKGRVRIALASSEQSASLTVNEYETLLMQHDLAEVLRNPLRFAAEKARHAWNDPMAVPAKAIGYAKYDFVRALNKLVDVLGLQASKLEQLVARAVGVPASRFLRMQRSIDLLVSDAATPGKGAVTQGTYQAPILVQWRAAPSDVRVVDVTVSRFR
jgi:thiamine phosphate synthase YjbQ (UPF0047 family)